MFWQKEEPDAFHRSISSVRTHDYLLQGARVFKHIIGHYVIQTPAGFVISDLLFSSHQSHHEIYSPRYMYRTLAWV